MATKTKPSKQWMVMVGFQNRDSLTIPCDDLEQAAKIYHTIHNLLTSETQGYRSRSDDWVEVTGANQFRATFNHIDAMWVRMEEQASWDDIF